MSVFRFKRFSVSNVRSAMKVNTDGCLLGACAPLRPGDGNVIDVGTGTGTVALMIAQRLSDSAWTPDFHITGIDIDEPSAQEAADNFASSPWSGHLRAECGALQEYVPGCRPDLIVSNPPYFERSLANPDARDASARHTGNLSYRDIFDFARRYSASRLCLVLPAETESELRRYAASLGYALTSLTLVRTTPRKAPSRIIAEFVDADAPGVTPGNVRTREFSIHDEKGDNSEEYVSLMKDFLLSC